MKKEPLDELARNLVGDGNLPDLYFVSVKGEVFLVTSDFELAYHAWLAKSVYQNVETALENRTYGVICSVEPKDDDDDTLITLDDSYSFRKEYL